MSNEAKTIYHTEAINDLESVIPVINDTMCPTCPLSRAASADDSGMDVGEFRNVAFSKAITEIVMTQRTPRLSDMNEVAIEAGLSYPRARDYAMCVLHKIRKQCEEIL